MLKIKDIEEKVLINRLLLGDHTAFELIFRFYYPGLVVFVKHIVNDSSEAEEIVQDFFVRLWLNRKGIKNTGSLKNYFFVSVKNKTFDYLKRNRIKENILGELKKLVESDSLYQPDLYIVSDLQDKITFAIEKLPNRTGTIFKLSRFDGLTNDEIANQLNLSKRTVETVISNALKILRQELKEYLFMLIVLGISLY
jgi:RNA polymerase sigma-70 factor (ECF subfamily)